MNLTGGIMLYMVLWFLTLFVLLPIGQRSQADAGEIVPGTHASAPHNLVLRRKLLLCTVIAAVLWGICAYIILGMGITRAQVETWDQLIRR